MKKSIFIAIWAVMLVGCKSSKVSKPVNGGNQNGVITEEPRKAEETEVWGTKPKEVLVDELGIPSDAIVLFNGENFNHWVSSVDKGSVKWDLNADGSMTVKDKTGDIQTKKDFGSMQLHIEWRSNPENKANSQHRSNSGVFLQNRYEVQILDNNDNDTYINGQVGSIYKQAIPLAKASSKTGDWNVYDIIYHEPEFGDYGSKIKSATVTVLHNGVLVQDHYEIIGTTEFIGWPKNMPHGKGPIKLQDHRDKSGVSFRNIWVREL